MIRWTLDELRSDAQRDLTEPKQGVLLDWEWRAAEATGELAAAREWLAFNEHRYRDLKGTVTGKWAPEEETPRSRECYRQLQELEQALSTARGELAYAQTVLSAIERVVGLLTYAMQRRRKHHVE